MIYLLLLSIILILIYEVRTRKSFVAPSVLLLLSFLMASLLIFINYINWDVSLTPKFLLYVLTAIISFVSCTHFTHYILKDLRSGKTMSLQRFTEISRPRWTMEFILIFVFLMYIVLYFRRVGFNIDLTAIMSSAYNENVSNSGNSGGFVETQLLKMITGIVYISFYQILLARYVVKSHSTKFILILNTTIFLLTAILSTDRNNLLRFFIFSIVLWIMFYFDSNKDYMKNINFKIFKRLILYGVIVLFVFYIAGRLKGYVSNFQRSISLYGGSGLYNFNILLNKSNGFQLKMGEETFKGVKVLLNTIFGTVSHETITFFDPQIAYKSSTGFVYISNIYSALRPFLLDFGYVGMILFPGIVGIFYETLYSVAIKNKYNFSWIIYSALIYSVVYFSISEQFFARFHLGSMYEIFWLIVFYQYVKSPIRFYFGSKK
ncbi:TPA: oligosaccharide repeat unit polymerase [Streptococcus suis]|nr:oligosaccharide repeat unit polymerase [Streptococcus suis]